MLGATPLFSVSWDNHAVRSLVNLRGIHAIDRPARQFFIQSPRCVEVALVADSAANRMLANFFLPLKREATPARVSTVEDEAVLWLRSLP